jgi:hypothetical protein
LPDILIQVQLSKHAMLLELMLLLLEFVEKNVSVVVSVEL